jgi:2-iminoacetate synthase ThiH
MRVELEIEEARELLVFLIERLSKEAGLSAADLATLRRWRASVKAGSDTMREFAAEINADLSRTLENQKKSAVIKPDWR